MTDKEQAPQAEDQSAEVGRGALYLTITKLWFLLSGYLILFILPRVLGDGERGVALFGKYQVVNGFAAIFNALVVQGTMQAVSRFVGRDASQGDGVRRAAYRLQAMVGGGLFAVQIITAPYIAENVYNDPTLTTPLRCAAFILLFYSFYAIFVGYLNGSKLFKKQAIIDFSYSTLKVVGVLAGAWALQDVFSGEAGGVAGAFAGFATAAGAVAVMGFVFSGRATGPGDTGVRELFKFQLFTMAFTFVATWVARGDLQILKIRLGGAENTDLVDVLAGHYGAAQAFSTIPYQLVFAITLVLFPLVSAYAGRDDDRLRTYIRQTTRYAAMIAMMIVCLFVSCPERTVNVLFKPEYAPAAEALRVLCSGYFFYSIFFIMCAIITASGRPGISVALVGVVGLIQAGLAWVLVEEHQNIGIAAATTTGMIIGMILAHCYLKKTYGQGVMASMLFKVVAAGLVVGAAAHFLFARATFWGGSGVLANVGGTGIVSKGVTVGGFGVLCVVYLGLLLVLGVFDDEDKARFGKILRRSK